MQEFESSSSYEGWDKKKIILSVLTAVSILGVVYGIKTYVLDAQTQNTARQVTKTSFTQVEGASTFTSSKKKSDDVSLPTPTDSIPQMVQDKVQLLQRQVTQLDPQEIASSSPQVQKLLNDIKALQQVPRNSAKDLCEQMCSKL